jgi:hypothetical protein
MKTQNHLESPKGLRLPASGMATSAADVVPVSEDTHLECVSDFCGNIRNPGAWADVFQRPDGSKYVALGGGWEFYAARTPERIEESDALYAPFLASCDAQEDFGFARLHWS